MILHVFNQAFGHSLGGAGTLVDQLYLHRRKTDRFLFVYPDHEHPPMLPAKVLVMSESQFKRARKLNFKVTTIYFHNFVLFHRNLPGKKVFVQHSCLLFEFDLLRGLGGNFEEMQSQYINVLARVDEVVCVSHYDKAILERYVWGLIEVNKIRVIPNGFNLTSRKPLRKQKPVKFFGYIGRLDDRKGIVSLAKNWAGLNHKLLIAGGGGLRSSLRTLTMLNPILNSNRNLIPIGFCTGKKKDDFFRKISALIVPSAYEPFGLVVLEAIHHGVPVIIPSFGGPIEILGADYPLTFSPWSAKSLGSIIEKFKSLSAADLSKIKLAYKKAAHFYSIENCVGLYHSSAPEVDEQR